MSWLSDWGTSKSSTTTQNDPWAPAQGDLKSILSGIQPYTANPGLTGTETGALGGLQGLANQGNPYAAGIGNYAASMLAGGGAQNQAPMVNNAWGQYQGQMQPTANGAYTDPNTNPFFAKTTAALSNDAWNRISSLYAGAGRDPAGAGNFGYNVSRGIGDATAPVYADAYNRERTNQLNASNNLFQGAGQTAGLLGGFQNQFNQNQGTGVGAANSALSANNAPYQQTLAIEAQRRGIPISLMQQLAGIAAPIAGLGGTGSSNTTQQASGMQQFSALAPMLGNIFGGSGGGPTGQGKSGFQQIAQLMGG
jgi:hypothetical protein